MSAGHNHEARLANFIFTVGTNKEFNLSVQSANINEISAGGAPFPTGKKDLVLPSNKIENSPLVIDFLVSQDYNEWVMIYKWMLECKNNNGTHLTHIKTCTLTALDSQNQPGTEFIYQDAFPIELTGVEHDVRVDTTDIITATVTLRFNKFKVVMPNGEVIDEQYAG